MCAFQIFEATDENDLIAAMEVLSGEHTLTKMKMSGVLASAHIIGREMQTSEIVDLTRKQAEEDRKLRLKLKEIRMIGEVLEGVKIRKGRIVGRVDVHVIYDPSA